MDKGGIRLEKGPLFRRVYDVPVSAVLAAEVRRTLLLRLLRGKKITLFTLSGKVSFYLKRDEPLIFLPQKGSARFRPKFASVLFGAFTDTRAFSGMIVFSAALARVGSIFGSDYYDGIVDMINRTAAGLSDLLDTLQIAVPRITAVLAVFAAAAWVFAFLRNVMKYARFAVSADREAAVIRHGLITLYERVVVRNNLGAVTIRDTASTLLLRAAPVYFRNMMILPPLYGDIRRRAVHTLLGLKAPAEFAVKPPKRALFGHIAMPLGWGGFNLALLILTYIAGGALMLRSLLWGGLALCAWYCILYGAYMYRSGIYRNNGILFAAARKGARLATLLLPLERESLRRMERNPFQRISGMCDISFYVQGGIRLRVRNMYCRSVSGLL